MRRFFRIIIKSLTVLSLLLCVGTCVLWGRSYNPPQGVSAIQYPQIAKARVFYAVGHDGKCLIIRRTWEAEGFDEQWVGGPGIRYRPFYFLLVKPRPGENTDVKWAGFRYEEGRDGDGGRIVVLAVPYCAVAILFAILGIPALLSMLRVGRRTKRRFVGHCPTCGYDLRATPDRCPECGTVPASTSIKGKQAGKPAPQLKPAVTHDPTQ